MGISFAKPSSRANAGAFLRDILIGVFAPWAAALCVYITDSTGHPSRTRGELLMALLSAGWTAAGFLGGVAAYLGVRAGEAGHGRYLRRGTGLVLGLWAAQGITGLLFCVGVSVYTAAGANSDPSNGGLTGRLVFSLAVNQLLLWLAVGLLLDIAGCAMGMAVGAKTRRPGGPASAPLGCCRGPKGVLPLGAVLVGFSILNVLGLWAYVRLSPWLLPRAPSVGLFSAWAVLGYVLAGGILGCTVVLWFLWSRVFAGSSGWLKWLLLLPLMALAAFAISWL